MEFECYEDEEDSGVWHVEGCAIEASGWGWSATFCGTGARALAEEYLHFKEYQDMLRVKAGIALTSP
jgi:hypothetical protein